MLPPGGAGTAEENSSGGNIHIGIYSERVPLPTQEVYTLRPDGIPIEPAKSRTGGVGVCREIEVSLMVNVNLAKQLILWLDTAIRNTESGVAWAAEATKKLEAEKK